MIPIHDTAGLEEIRRRLRIDPVHFRHLRNAFYKKHRSVEEALRQLPERQHDVLRAEVAFHALTLRSRHDSELDGASKLLFRTAAGDLIETVILRIASG